MAKVKFVKSKTKEAATTAAASDSDPIGVYFPTDSDTIIVGGTEYGKSVTAADNHYTPERAKTISATGGGAATWGSTQMVTGIDVDAKGHVVGVSSIKMPANPNTDTNTHYVTGINAGASGATSNSAQTNPYVTVKDDSTYRAQIQLKGGGATTVTSDANGVVTISSTDTNTNTTYSAGTGLTLSGTTFKATLNSETSLGTIGTTSKLYAVGVDANGKLAVNVPWTDNNTTYSAATTSAAGLMSASDKTKLDGIASGAEVNQNAFQSVIVNGTDIYIANSKQDALSFAAGNNVSLSLDTDSGQVTINSSYSTTATKLGTSTVGGTAKPIYLSSGTATACSSTVGSATKPVYMSSGTITAGSTYAGGTAVTLNGSSKGASTASFYAPTSAGTSGYYLRSNGSGAPSWSSLDVEKVKGYQQATITTASQTQGLYVECETTYINTTQGFTLSGFWSHTGSSTTPEYGKEYKLIVFNYTTSTNTLTINGTFGLSSHTVIYNGTATSGSAKTVSMSSYTYHQFTINVLPDSKTGTTLIFINKV